MSFLDIIQNNTMARLGNAGSLGNTEYSFLAIAPRFNQAGVVVPDRVLSMGQIEMFDIETLHLC